MIIAIASGKGGTGKTIVASSLAVSIDGNVQFIDCDVEEPNAHIFLKPVIEETRAVSIPVPEIDRNRCTLCGRCVQVCAFNALAVIPSSNEKEGTVLVFRELCHGCGSCSHFCAQKAINEVDRQIGIVEVGRSNSIQFVHGILNIGEAMAPPLIKEIKTHIKSTGTVIIDAPPGTSCPVIESIKDSDFCILVTEPTPFGLNDLVLSVEVIRKLGLPFGVVINRFDLGDGETIKFCRDQSIPVLMKIPFRKKIAVSYSKGETLVSSFPKYREDFMTLFEKCRQRVKDHSG